MESEEPNEIILNSSDMKQIFQSNATNLRITDVALYSFTPYVQADYTVKIIFAYHTIEEINNMIITDAGGCIGGNTMVFSKYFNEVNYVELNPLHAEIFRHNLHILMPESKNINIYNDDYTATDLKQDIIFFDPPWGGKDYMGDEKLELYYSGIPLYQIIEQKNATSMFIKAPKNYDHRRLFETTKFRFKDIYSIMKNNGKIIYNIIALSNNRPQRKVINFMQTFMPLNYRKMRYTVKK